MPLRAFVIMQLGTDESDRLYEEAIEPALGALGMTVTRADRHSAGGLLVAEILGHLASADLVVADLTGERPSCYFEVGYAFGRGKEARVILTARHDHIPGAPGFRAEGPKVHFDLAGYEVLGWRPDFLVAFREALGKRARRRLALPRAAGSEAAARHAEVRRRVKRPTRRTANLRMVGRRPEEQVVIDLASGLAGAALGILMVVGLARIGPKPPLAVYAAMAVPTAVFGFFVPEHLLPAAAAARHRGLVESLRGFVAMVGTMLALEMPLEEILDEGRPKLGRSTLSVFEAAIGERGPGWPWEGLYRTGVSLGSVPPQQVATHAACARDNDELVWTLRAEEDALVAWIMHDEGRVHAVALFPVGMMYLCTSLFLMSPMLVQAWERRP